MLAGFASAEVILPGTSNLRFEGISALGTSAQPFINVATGDYVSRTETDGPVTMTAFGQINSILNSNNSNDKGRINGELTFSYTGATLTPFEPPKISTTDNSVTINLNSRVEHGTIALYDHTGGTPLNTAASIGGPVAVPAEVASGGTLFLQGTTPTDTLANIVITYFRPTPTADFNNFTILLQGLNGGQFEITGGSILTGRPDLRGKFFQLSQDGLFSHSFASETVNGIARNAAVDALVEGDVVLATQPGNVVPEPASVALVIGGLILITGFTGRRNGRRSA